ncbi:hypothetical protein AZ09_05770 [Acetobacter aceti 1023]|nr:hypothetical protein AZ09_05770 [Acetobacter aceti 1023]
MVRQFPFRQKMALCWAIPAKRKGENLSLRRHNPDQVQRVIALPAGSAISQPHVGAPLGIL